MRYGIIGSTLGGYTGYYGNAGYYGDIISYPAPFIVTALTIIREDTYAILKWDPVTTDVFDKPQSQSKYFIYRGINSRQYSKVGEVSTRDYYGNLDTFYIDSGFYKIIAISANSISSEFSDEFTDYYINEPNYQDTNLYSYNKTSYFWKQVENLNGQFIYNKARNIIPYIPKKPFIFTDYVQGYSYTTFIVKLNGNEYTRVRKIPGSEYIYFMLDLSSNVYKTISLEIVAEDDPSIVIRTYSFQVVNLYLFLSTMAEDFRKLYIDSIRTGRDLYKDEVSDEHIYSNFMTLLGFEKQDYWTFDDYYDISLGGKGYDNGIFTDYIDYAGTYGGLKKNEYSLTTQVPSISSYKDKQGWVLQSLDASGISTYDHFYLQPTDRTSNPPIIMYSAKQKAFTIEVEVAGSTATFERIITKSSTAYDQIPATNILEILYLKDANSISYTENVDFTVDYELGVITWLSGAGTKRPSYGISFGIGFTVSIKTVIDYVVDINKPAYIFAKIKYV